jgi:hypothetical protein
MSDGRFTSNPLSAFIDHEFFNRDDPRVDWLAGLIAADGCIKDNGRYWTLAQSGPAGLEIVKHVQAMIGHQLTVCESQPIRGQKVYEIYVPSAMHVTSLRDKYLIEPRKTLTYRWPDLTHAQLVPFLRGYIDGDGCVTFGTNQYNVIYISLSMVGTEKFIEGLRNEPIPTGSKVRKIERCKNLAEIRWDGERAWDACSWIYQSDALPDTTKLRRWTDYRRDALATPPRWLAQRPRREAVEACLADGLSLRETARSTGVHLSVICKWKAKGLVA